MNSVRTLTNTITPMYSGIYAIASRILHEICLLIGELATVEPRYAGNENLRSDFPH